jgi:uncharacterized protein (TIGR03067 family)
MKTRLGMFAALLLAMLFPFAATSEDKKEEKFDAAKLVGTWAYVSGEKDGKKSEADALKGQSVIITKESITLKGDLGKFVLSYDIDAKKSPMTVMLKITESPFGAGMKAAGIIELKGDDLKICYAPESEEAPKGFEAKEGSKHHYFVLKRSK